MKETDNLFEEYLSMNVAASTSGNLRIMGTRSKRSFLSKDGPFCAKRQRVGYNGELDFKSPDILDSDDSEDSDYDLDMEQHMEEETSQLQDMVDRLTSENSDLEDRIRVLESQHDHLIESKKRRRTNSTLDTVVEDRKSSKLEVNTILSIWCMLWGIASSFQGPAFKAKKMKNIHDLFGLWPISLQRSDAQQFEFMMSRTDVLALSAALAAQVTLDTMTASAKLLRPRLDSG